MTAPSCDVVVESNPVVDAIREEYRAWRSRLGYWYGQPLFPEPSDEGGLPEGWCIRAWAWSPQRFDRPGQICRVFLVSRRAGGWIALRHMYSGSGPARVKVVPNFFEATLGELYVGVCGRVDSASVSSGPIDYEALMREFIYDAYDEADPAEWAERMLVGLGARPRAIPASLMPGARVAH